MELERGCTNAEVRRELEGEVQMANPDPGARAAAVVERAPREINGDTRGLQGKQPGVPLQDLPTDFKVTEIYPGTRVVAAVERCV